MHSCSDYFLKDKKTNFNFKRGTILDVIFIVVVKNISNTQVAIFQVAYLGIHRFLFLLNQKFCYICVLIKKGSKMLLN